MPRYSFNVHDVEPSIDNEGAELPDDEAAWKEATTFAGAVCQDIDGKFRPGQEWSVEVLNEAGKTIYFIFISSRRMP
ncbi:DUF6894 family protein [Bradyrhizobium japonicum]|jgi:hypothetical protein|uniref:DUF6894 family protein n=1 Tax=Bradyrhizobium japonicum TaxID=375 RepID=UPI0005776312|nr:hypothetical protein JEY30_46275 [Bradyrhizobium japonicum]UQD98766.1 hypothetical protein JEY30_00165 [Bradyrhizobium japonicum]